MIVNLLQPSSLEAFNSDFLSLSLTVAQAAGIDAMVGCMLESKLGIAASLAVANSASNVKFTDLDGFTYLSEQPFTGGLNLNKGMDVPIDGVGFSTKPNNELKL